jgi:cupin superfamily acireductone dioxygenase involved in methionine salvage
MTIEQTKQQIEILKDMTKYATVDQSRIAEAQDMYQKVILQLKQEKQRLEEECKYLMQKRK